MRVLDSLIHDLNIDADCVNISKMSTKYGCLYKLNLNNNYLTIGSILKSFSILSKNYTIVYIMLSLYHYNICSL